MLTGSARAFTNTATCSEEKPCHGAPSPSGIDDQRLIAALRAGDEWAYETMIRLYGGRLLAVARRFTRNEDDAQDVLQSAYLSAFRALKDFEGTCQLSTWLHRIVVNICIDRLRLKSASTVALDDVAGILPSDDDPARTVEGLQLGGRIGAALGQLSPKHRVALVLREVQGLSYQEIASAMDCSVGTVMSRLFHARKRMQALLLADEPAYALAA